MAYLGRQPIIGNYQVLDALTASATATYALTKNSVAVFPQTPANCIVSLNGVIQAPFDSYTISGSNIVFASALTGSDSIDFITVLGDVLNVGTVSDNTITTAKLADSSVSLAKLTATGTKDATTFLRGDNTFASAGGTNTPAFQAYRSGNQTISNSAYTKMNYNAEIFDTDGCYDNSTNYRFTPTTAGKYFLYAQVQSQDTTDINDNFISIRKNGTDIAFNNTPHLHYHTKAVSGIATANGSSDYFEVFVFNNTGGASFTMYGTDEASYFGGFKIIE
jgi:hypothetical protein